MSIILNYNFARKKIEMTREIIEAKINEYLKTEFSLEDNQLTPDSRLREDIGLDSLDTVDIAIAVKKIFGFRMNTAEMQNVKTLSQFYSYVEQNIAH